MIKEWICGSLTQMNYSLKSFFNILLCFFLSSTFSYSQKITTIGRKSDLDKVEIKGKIIDKKTGEGIPGVNFVLSQNGIIKGVSSDGKGNYTLIIAPGNYLLTISSIGYDVQKKEVKIMGSGKFNVSLVQDVHQLEEIFISANSEDNVKGSLGGKEVISVEAIREIPPFLGELDVLKTLTLLPGVSTIGEASSGFNIRGGGTDQNLILLDGVTLYNSSHLFGFLSGFNSELVDNLTLYKGGIPSNFGGRGSGVIDINYKKSNFNRWQGVATLGTGSSNISASGPIIKEHLAITVAGRVSYVDWILDASNSASLNNSNAFFFDGNIILDFKINDNNSLHYSYYKSGDSFSFASDTVLNWGNEGHSFNFIHSFNKKLFIKAVGAISKYSNNVSNNGPTNNFILSNSVEDYFGDISLNLELNTKNKILVGFQAKIIEVQPGSIVPSSEASPIQPKQIDRERGRELSAFVSHEVEFGSFGLTYGARFTKYDFLGPNTTYIYKENLPRSNVNIIDSINYQEGEIAQSYQGFEPRASLRWSINSNSSVKLGFNRMFQYINVVSNTSSISPTDIWKLADTYVKPQEVIQYSLGYFKNLRNNVFETSVEGYFKTFDNLLEYKDGANLFLNETIETALLNGIGYAYGVELYVKKKKGLLTGWVSYVYSRSLRKVSGAYPEEQVNNGEWYASNFDKPHDFTAVAKYEINKNISISSIFTYSTGRPITYPSAKIEYAGKEIAYFDSRNSERAPDYHRLDVSLNFNFETNVKLLSGDWVFSVYNLYGRKNAFSVFFDDIAGSPPQPFQLSVLGVPYPSLTYRLNF